MTIRNKTKIQLPEEELPPEEKIWVILKEINNAVELAPKDDEAVIDPVKLDKFMMRAEQEQIFKKLEKDYKFLTIRAYPDTILLDMGSLPLYRFKVYGMVALRGLIDEAHSKQFGSLAKLSGENFLSVVDVSRDISDALQMTPKNEVRIPLLQMLVKFINLMPADGINFRDRYCDLRWQACGYLKDNGYIESCDIDDTGFHRWEYQIKITLNRLKWDDFYNKLSEKAQKRIIYESAQKEKKEAGVKQPNLHTVAQAQAIKNLLDKSEEKEQLKTEIKKELQDEGKNNVPINSKPHTLVKDGIGYFKFYKEGANIKIGSADTRPFKYLQCLCNPSFSVQKTTEEVFDSVKIQKDLKDSILTGFDSPQKKSRIITIIKNSCIKELQKIKELDKLKYNFNPQETRIWLSLEE